MNLKQAAIGGTLLALLSVAVATPVFAQKVSAGGNTSLAVPSENPAVRYNMGVQLLQQKDYAHAVLAFRDVLDKDQRNANANYFMGIAYIGLNDYQQSVGYLRMAVKSNPKLVDARAKLGTVEAKLGNADAAKDQRAALDKMSKACNGTCPDAAALAAGMTLIDQTLAEAAPKPG